MKNFGQQGHRNEVNITLMPVFTDPPMDKLPKKELPEAIPTGMIGGGVVMGKNDELFVPGKGVGGGAASIFASNDVVMEGRFMVLGAGVISPLLAGLLLALLLLLAALIWACWKCKPGCCAACAGKFGNKAGGGGGDGWRKAAAVCCAAPEKDILIHDKTAYGNGIRDMQDHGYVSNLASAHGYGHDRQLDISPGIDGGVSTIRVDQPLLDGQQQNVYNSEMKVDACIISQNSKYVVTGSSTGPPQVWDMQTGDLIKYMDGLEMAATDLHLGCNDTVLVGQVLDEAAAAGGAYSSYSSKLHRLQLWEFSTGQQMEMPEEILCSATCMTRRDQQMVIVARSSNMGPSILVWDLIANEMNRELFYTPINPTTKDEVKFLDISFDDRLVVAGIQNPVDDIAYYLVFDLSAHYPVHVEPTFITFNAEVMASAVMSNEEVITGTKAGELIVWHMLTCQPIRQVQISATLEGNNPVMLPPHNGAIHCVALSRDGQFLVTGSADRTARVWNRADERLLHTLEGHNDDVLSVCISADSEVIVTGSWDGSIRVWRLRDGNQMCWFTSNIEILEVKISTDKRGLVALGERCGNRKLIMLQILRNRTRTTTMLRSGGSRTHLGPPLSPGTGPTSPMMLP